jgi:quinol monooxygenase YgiN
MILVWGSVEALDESLEEMLRLSLEHVARSRGEPGCISHTVSIDAENQKRLNFFEEWKDLDALHRHFEVSASVEFAARLVKLSTEPPELRIYDSSRIP